MAGSAHALALTSRRAPRRRSGRARRPSRRAPTPCSRARRPRRGRVTWARRRRRSSSSSSGARRDAPPHAERDDLDRRAPVARYPFRRSCSAGNRREAPHGELVTLSRVPAVDERLHLTGLGAHRRAGPTSDATRRASAARAASSPRDRRGSGQERTSSRSRCADASPTAENTPARAGTMTAGIRARRQPRTRAADRRRRTRRVRARVGRRPARR